LTDIYLLLSTNHPPVGQKLCLFRLGLMFQPGSITTSLKFIVYISKIVSISPTTSSNILILSCKMQDIFLNAIFLTEVEDKDILSLSNPVDSPNTLLNLHWVPG